MYAQVHRFRDRVAVYVGDGQTVYMDDKTARKLAKALNGCARSVKHEPSFAQSTFKSTSIEFEGELT